jgi:hypothetical protein
MLLSRKAVALRPVERSLKKGGDRPMVDSLGSTTGQTEAARVSHRIPSPWILGLYSLSGATFLAASRWAGWYGGSGAESRFLLLPLAAVLWEGS